MPYRNGVETFHFHPQHRHFIPAHGRTRGSGLHQLPQDWSFQRLANDLRELSLVGLQHSGGSKPHLHQFLERLPDLPQQHGLATYNVQSQHQHFVPVERCAYCRGVQIVPCNKIHRDIHGLCKLSPDGLQHYGVASPRSSQILKRMPDLPYRNGVETFHIQPQHRHFIPAHGRTRGSGLHQLPQDGSFQRLANNLR